MCEETTKLLKEVRWNEDGLVPAIVQSVQGEVLTLGWMNEKALRLTIKKGICHYFSRSKGRIRKKGEVSGNLQKVEQVKIDCDADSLLVLVNQKGPACHTGQRSCFYRELGQPQVEEGKIDYSLNILKKLEELIRKRKSSLPEDSYTAELFREGAGEIDKKFGEEAIEVIVSEGKEALISETADLLYHLLVLLGSRETQLEEVMSELAARRKGT